VAEARAMVWTRGLQRACAQSAFARFAPSVLTAKFDHDVLVDTGKGCATGRLWEGRDGRGRGGWPMGIVAGVEGAGAGWVVEQASARGAAAEHMTGETRSSELVRFSLGELASQLEDASALVMDELRASESDGSVLSRLRLCDGGEAAIARCIAALKEAATPGA